ncbi:hypothetical protein BKA70DRAFT_1565676 [Coprinopsis sp. MPI-PUGE-AT-0042]|nr:hypothetical protein BKA70DRAFT_1565676 [Coprinopsis sp. MPI-PUGE-AT-0042]
MPSKLPAHRNSLDALVAHYQPRSGSSSSHFGRPILRWLALSTILIAGLGTLEKLNHQVPWMNNRRPVFACATRYLAWRQFVRAINGWSLTAVEALSTMWLMDMKTGFGRTVRILERKTFTNPATTSPFSKPPSDTLAASSPHTRKAAVDVGRRYRNAAPPSAQDDE